MLGQNIAVEFVRLFHFPVEGARGGEERLNGLQGAIAGFRVDWNTVRSEFQENLGNERYSQKKTIGIQSRLRPANRK